MRTHDPQLPWPEEEYRTAIDARADLLFAPTGPPPQSSRRSGSRGEIHVTGNTADRRAACDRGGLPPRAGPRARHPRILVTCHRRESWGEGLQSIAAALRKLARAAESPIDCHPAPQRACRGRDAQACLAGWPGMSLLDPCGHRELVAECATRRSCSAIPAGSRKKRRRSASRCSYCARRPSGRRALQCGNARLVGTSSERIVEEVERLLGDPVALAAMSRRSFPMATADAAPRIAAIIEDWLRTLRTGIRGNPSAGDPYGTRTRVFAVRGRRPRPLDEGASAASEAAICGLDARASQSVELEPHEGHRADRDCGRRRAAPAPSGTKLTRDEPADAERQLFGDPEVAHRAERDLADAIGRAVPRTSVSSRFSVISPRPNSVQPAMLERRLRRHRRRHCAPCDVLRPQASVPASFQPGATSRA